MASISASSVLMRFKAFLAFLRRAAFPGTPFNDSRILSIPSALPASMYSASWVSTGSISGSGGIKSGSSALSSSSMEFWLCTDETLFGEALLFCFLVLGVSV